MILDRSPLTLDTAEGAPADRLSVTLRAIGRVPNPIETPVEEMFAVRSWSILDRV